MTFARSIRLRCQLAGLSSQNWTPPCWRPRQVPENPPPVPDKCTSRSAFRNTTYASLHGTNSLLPLTQAPRHKREGKHPWTRPFSGQVLKRNPVIIGPERPTPPNQAGWRFVLCSTSGVGGPGFSGDWSLDSGPFQGSLSTRCQGAYPVASIGRRQSGNVPRQFHRPRLADADPSSFTTEPPKHQKSKHHHQHSFFAVNSHLSIVLPPLFVVSQYTLFPGPCRLRPRLFPPISPPTSFHELVAVCLFAFRYPYRSLFILPV